MIVGRKKNVMVEVSVTGSSMEELKSVTAELYQAQRLLEQGNPGLIEEVIEVEEAVKDLTKSGKAVSRSDIEDHVDIESGIYAHLQLLKTYGIINTSGKGGSWTYTGN